MHTLTVHARVEHGALHIDTPVYVPDDVPDGDHEVLIAIASGATTSPMTRWPDGYFEETYGSLADVPLERPEQGAFEQREPLE
jgi:hypothetical protein